MEDKLYAQLDESSICVCIGTPKTDIEVSDYLMLGNRYVGGLWEIITPPEPEPEPVPAQPTNADVAQMISDLQADLIIAGVI